MIDPRIFSTCLNTYFFLQKKDISKNPIGFVFIHVDCFIFVTLLLISLGNFHLIYWKIIVFIIIVLFVFHFSPLFGHFTALYELHFIHINLLEIFADFNIHDIYIQKRVKFIIILSKDESSKQII